MKSLDEVSEKIKDATAIVIETFNRQVKQVVRLVTKQPKKPPLSWDSIIGDSGVRKKTKLVVAENSNLPTSPLVNQQLAELPNEVFEELLTRLQKNTLDEILIIRLYEKLFESEVKIIRGHLHFYKCTRKNVEETIDFTTLTSRLIELFVDHKKNCFTLNSSTA